MVSNNIAWENIFSRYRLLDKINQVGYADIEAKQIKAVDGKEPRIMTKIDSREDLPPIMQDNKLSILAIKNGEYRIAHTDPFIKIQELENQSITEIEPPKNIICLDPLNVTSESNALDLAYISGMLNELFGQKSSLVIRGRMRGDINFSLQETNYEVKGVQMEVDSGYETSSSLNLIEAKIGYRSNLNIRQLLYPQLFWQQKLQQKKAVKSFIFLLDSNVYRFIPYVYDGTRGYAAHDNERAFRFNQVEDDFYLHTISGLAEPINLSAPFPQADSFTKIDSMLIVLLEKKSLPIDYFGSLFDIVPRQVDYYTSVLKWLRLVDGQDTISLNSQGKRIARLPFQARMRALAEIIFSDPLFNARLNGRKIDDKFFAMYKISGSTIRRRMQTVDAWINYFKTIFH